MTQPDVPRFGYTVTAVGPDGEPLPDAVVEIGPVEGGISREWWQPRRADPGDPSTETCSDCSGEGCYPDKTTCTSCMGTGELPARRQP